MIHSPTRMQSPKGAMRSQSEFLAPNRVSLKFTIVTLIAVCLVMVNYYYFFSRVLKSDILIDRCINSLTDSSVQGEWWRRQSEELFVSNKSSLSFESFHIPPFDPGLQINIWDIYTPDVSCPSLRRVGRIGDG